MGLVGERLIGACGEAVESFFDGAEAGAELLELAGEVLHGGLALLEVGGGAVGFDLELTLALEVVLAGLFFLLRQRGGSKDQDGEDKGEPWDRWRHGFLLERTHWDRQL